MTLPRLGGGHSGLSGAVARTAVVVLVALAGTVAGPAAGQPARRPGGADADADARPLYQADCAVCHGSDGRGTGRGPTLVGVGSASVDYELATGRMPLNGAGRGEVPGRPVQPLPDAQRADPDQLPRRHHPAYGPETIAALVRYVATLTGDSGPPVPSVAAGAVSEGGRLFRLECAACHAWAGDGGALLHREAPKLHDATPVQIAEAVRVGPGQMPAFGTAALTDDQVDAVVAYVRYLNHTDDRGGDPLWHLGPVAEGAASLLALAGLLLLTRWIGERG